MKSVPIKAKVALGCAFLAAALTFVCLAGALVPSPPVWLLVATNVSLWAIGPLMFVGCVLMTIYVHNAPDP